MVKKETPSIYYKGAGEGDTGEGVVDTEGGGFAAECVTVDAEKVGIVGEGEV